MRSLEGVPFSTIINASPYRARASRPSAPLKEASRLLLDVASTPPASGGELPASHSFAAKGPSMTASFGLFLHEHTRCITCRLLSRRMHRSEERQWGGISSRAQFFSVRRHIAAARDALRDQLVMREAYSDCIECRPPPAPHAVESMAVVALLDFKDKRALSLQSCSLVEVL